MKKIYEMLAFGKLNILYLHNNLFLKNNQTLKHLKKPPGGSKTLKQPIYNIILTKHREAEAKI